MVDGTNEFEYANDNPVNEIDPDGYKVIEAEHAVALVGEHRYTILQPDNPEAFRDNSLFYVNSKGQLESTISGEPVGGTVESVPNFDRNSKVRSPTVINPPNGESDTEFINALLNAESQYQNNLPYSALPFSDGTYNSNSFNSGILNAVGVATPDLPYWSPGADKPISIETPQATNWAGKESH